VGGSASLPPTSVVGQVLTWNIASLTLIDDNISITFDATVDATVATGSVLTNGANLSSTSWPGANPDERTYTDADTSDVGVGETTFIDAVKTVGLVIDADASTDVTPGDTLEYQVTLTNSGADATSVVFTDPIPVGTTYVAASLTASVGTVDDSDPTNLVVNVGPMLDGATVTITFRVTVNAGVAEGFIISNQGSVDSDQTLPEPTDVDGVDPNGDQPTDIPVGGAPSLDNPLRLTKTVFWLVDADLSGDVTPGDTMSYSFVIQNLGDTDLTAVSLTDTVPNGLTPVGGTETITGAGNTISVVGQALSASIPTLPAGSVVTAGVAVTIDGPPLFDTDADPNRETFVNQAAADSAETDPVPSDGNNDPTDARPADLVHRGGRRGRRAGPGRREALVPVHRQRRRRAGGSGRHPRVHHSRHQHRRRRRHQPESRRHHPAGHHAGSGFGGHQPGHRRHRGSGVRQHRRSHAGIDGAGRLPGDGGRGHARRHHHSQPGDRRGRQRAAHAVG
jgi:uncharacterized repeat protein (TIGR01451 family)